MSDAIASFAVPPIPALAEADADAAAGAASTPAPAGTACHVACGALLPLNARRTPESCLAISSGGRRPQPGAGSRGPRRQDIEATPEAAVQLIQLDLAAASSRLEARLRYGLQRRARSVTSAGPGRRSRP